jgi:hypothetical protein
MYMIENNNILEENVESDFASKSCQAIPPFKYICIQIYDEKKIHKSLKLNEVSTK